jgi:hypothetical protein
MFTQFYLNTEDVITSLVGLCTHIHLWSLAGLAFYFAKRIDNGNLCNFDRCIVPPFWADKAIIAKLCRTVLVSSARLATCIPC